MSAESLKGKRILFAGDSICEGAIDPTRRAWAGRIAETYGLEAKNVSIGGQCMSDVRGDRVRIVGQIHREKGNTYDYVILQGGVNDAWGTSGLGGPLKIAPVGTVSDSFDPATFDVTTFTGGMEDTLYWCRQYFPNARLGFMSMFAMPEAKGIGRVTEIGEYYDMAEVICKKWGVDYLGMFHDEHLNEDLMEVHTLKNLKDPIHPNVAGYEILAPYIGKWLETLD